MRDLSKDGKFEIGTELLAKINKEVFAGFATEMENRDEEKAIKQLEILMNDYHTGIKDLEKKSILHNSICEIKFCIGCISIMMYSSHENFDDNIAVIVKVVDVN
ncbi:hypothetical protein AN639_07850 [Candidatus Epulonipiscium fishelsonii]|uniref:Uncharacterized protein n=1 Tax=Candidatus Epulonipiscium fishelsonii TaxID=77094 RepID=A0ACC8X8Y3_9FIRM|nr:hypothetical protein AN396_11040 [Epulopiscium sp. SCG-B11WGA-EpuloA1]ONI38409.1 hypothetical protein AN639_07850 [Epulopiscium sp. SCG-B05WGA-EpuloA1]